jgi:hypothetical protein
MSATVESLEYDVSIDNTSNILKIALLNDVGDDINNDGDFNDEGETLKVIVSSLSYSTDNINFTSLIPQVETTYTVPSGLYAGNVVTLTNAVNTFVSYDANWAITFNSDGIVQNEYCEGVRYKVLPNGSIQDLINGITYDSDGNIV